MQLPVNDTRSVLLINVISMHGSTLTLSDTSTLYVSKHYLPLWEAILSQRSPSCSLVKINRGEYIATDFIDHVLAVDQLVNVAFCDGRTRPIYGTVKSFAEHDDFIHIHRNCAVNRNRIKGTTRRGGRSKIQTTGGYDLDVSLMRAKQLGLAGKKQWIKL